MSLAGIVKDEVSISIKMDGPAFESIASKSLSILAKSSQVNSEKS